MSELILIRQELSESNPAANFGMIPLTVDRLTLVKRRWRGVADDGREFGFDLAQPLVHGALFFQEGSTVYAVAQLPEAVLEIPLGTLEQAARVAWQLGNLHFGIQVSNNRIHVADDPAVLQLLAREHIPFQRVSSLFLPLSAGASHHHD